MGRISYVSHVVKKQLQETSIVHEPDARLKQHGGLATLYRDKSYLAMEEDQKAKRLLVLSKTKREAWIKTEAQAIVDRAKVQQCV